MLTLTYDKILSRHSLAELVGLAWRTTLPYYSALFMFLLCTSVVRSTENN